MIEIVKRFRRGEKVQFKDRVLTFVAPVGKTHCTVVNENGMLECVLTAELHRERDNDDTDTGNSNSRSFTGFNPNHSARPYRRAS